MKKYQKVIKLSKKELDGKPLTKKEREFLRKERERARWGFLDIKNKRIKKLAQQVFRKLSWINVKKKEESGYCTLIDECVERVLLRKINPYKKELQHEIEENKEYIKKFLKREVINPDFIPELKTETRLLEQELKSLNKEDIKNTLGYCKQIFFPKKKSHEYPKWKIVLIEDNIKNLSDRKIKLLIGHEVAHVYIHIIVKHGYINHYEIDDLHLCDFIAKKLFKVV